MRWRGLLARALRLCGLVMTKINLPAAAPCAQAPLYWRNRAVRLGFVPVIDCAPLLVGAQLRLFEKHGVEVVIERQLGWATVRDKIFSGELDGSHAVAGLSLSMPLGLHGHRCEVIAPFVMNLHGNAITLSLDLWRRGVRDAASLRKLIRSTPHRLLTLAAVSRHSYHLFLLRSWLASGGIDPDRDVRIVVLPPTQLVGNLADKLIDGCCVGEPWTSEAVARGLGWCAATSDQIAPGHVEKVLLLRADFAHERPEVAPALIRALDEACRFCDAPGNRAEVAERLAASGHFTAPVEVLKRSLCGPFDLGTGAVRDAKGLHIFHGDAANVPTTARARAVLAQFRHHALIPDTVAAELAPRLPTIWREDLYRLALDGAGVSRPDSAPLMKRKPASPRAVRRRTILKSTAALGLSSLIAGLPRGWAGSVHASDAPESPDVKLGIIALTDCSSFVIAHEKGFFKKHGINATITKGASWAAVRDSLTNGDIHGSHMLIGMPIASTLGLAGAPKKPMIAPFLINRNGQAITLANKFRGKVQDDPKALKPFVDEAKKAGTPLTFAMTFPPGTHAMWMRYWLAAGGIHPGDAKGGGGDVSLVTVPPPQMVANMKIGKMDGFCVGEPWGARSIADDVGYTAITTQAIWNDHPEKVCAFTAEWAARNPKTVKAVLKALHEAGVWLDNMENRVEQAKIVSAATYINCPPEIILGRLQGKYAMGDGRKFRDPAYMIFSDRNCNYPQLKYARWWLTQLRRWGFVETAPDYDAVSRQVMRPDIYEEAMKEIGWTHGGPDNRPETLFDGRTFDPESDPEAYAAGFDTHSIPA